MKNMKTKPQFLLIITAIFTSFAPQALAFRPIASDPDTGVVLEGMDVITYRDAEGPRKGHPAYQVEWKGVFWRFESLKNMNRFQADPDRYAPVFGGYCAMCMSDKESAPSHCEINLFAIHEDRLYMFATQEFLALWLEDPKNYIEVADQSYEGLLASIPTTD